MAGDLNRATLLGRLGKDPEVRVLTNGSRVVNFNLATGEDWRDKNTGERKSKTQWHKVVIWNEGLGKVAEQYLRKGSKVFIEGKIETREYQDRDGAKRWTTEIVLNGFDAKLLLQGDRQGGGDSGDRDGGYRDDGGSRQSSGGRGGGRYDDMDDEIPF